MWQIRMLGRFEVVSAEARPATFRSRKVGSLLALLTFPFVVEPWLGSSAQINVWRVAFAVFLRGSGRAEWDGALAAKFNWKLIDELSPLGGIRIEDMVAVTDDGRELLTQLSKDLIVL